MRRTDRSARLPTRDSRVGGDLPYVHSRHQATAYAARRACNGASVVALMVFIDTLKIVIVSTLLHD